MTIRTACRADLPAIMDIYARARAFMHQNGNPCQWGNSYPEQAVVERDIADSTCCVCIRTDSSTQQEHIEAVFTLAGGADPTYRHIEDGQWLSDAPYCTIHRLAVRSPGQGTASFCLRWAYRRCRNLRIDTHKDNTAMQRVITKNGFLYCGRIYASDGTPRLAYQKQTAVEPDRLLSLISRIHTAVSVFIKEELERQGLTELVSSHGNILHQLAEHGALPMKELALRINRDKSTTTVLVRKLEAAGYVSRCPSKTDNRSISIRLTAKGAEYTEATKTISQRLIGTCYQGFSPEEREQLYLLLSDIAENFQALHTAHTAAPAPHRNGN